MKKFTIPFILFLIVSSLSAQTSNQLKQIDQLLSSWNNATPGVAVAVQQGDKIIYNKAFGLADLEHNIPNTTETVFESGSVAKQFTAMSILLLAAEGKLSVTDDIRKYVPEIPKYNTTITIQMLLNHTSGLKDWGSVGSLTGWPRTTRVYSQDLALQIMSKQKSTNYTPGTEYSYSNSNYSLLVTIVERVSGKSLATFTEENLFKPLGMTNTQWRDNFREVVPNRAIAYRKQNEVYEQLMPFEDIHGHGGLLTTTGDLLKWNTLLETHSLGGKQVYNWRIQKGKLTSGKEIIYAAGLNVSKFFGFDEISHSGATAGYRAWLAYYPEKKISIVALSNDGSFNPTGIGRQIAEIIVPDPKSPQLDFTPVIVDESGSDYVRAPRVLTEPDLKKFEGIWRSVRHMDVQTIERKDNLLFNNKTRGIVISRDTLYFDKKWVSTKPGRITILNWQDSLSYYKVTPADLSATSLNSLAGTYKSDEADAIYLVEIKNNMVWINNKPFAPFQLLPSFKDGFFSADGNLYEFRRDKRGKITQLLVSTGRAIHVSFNKVK